MKLLFHTRSNRRTLALLAKLVPYLMKLALLADVVSIPLLSFLLKLQLLRWQKQGLLSHYRVNLRRRGKLYELNIHLVFRSSQAKRILMDLLPEIQHILAIL